jgi:uncharacterized phage protein (TIGR01671 family)
MNGNLMWDFGYNPIEYVAEPNDYILMQFTGLKDKNGKEIYEGDIIRFYDTIESVMKISWTLFVKWNEYYAGFCLWKDYEGGATSHLPITKEGIEIIGNLYENGDLLK